LAREGSKQKRPRPRSAGVKPVSYTTTKVLRPNAEFLKERRIITPGADAAVIDAYKLLRTRVLHRLRQNHWNVLGVTSAGASTGKTLTAINLAISIAMSHDQTVLLVDADLRKPAVHRYMGLEVSAGLPDYLSAGAEVEDLFINPGIPRMVILPGVSPDDRGRGQSSELLASPRMSDLVDELKSRYETRIIVFDLPPVLVGDDVVAFAPALDAVMLVVEDAQTQSDEFSQTVDLLDNVDILGVVLNKSKARAEGYGDYYNYERSRSDD
jgi:capsular exopolysaccharide synthesis family protein